MVLFSKENRYQKILNRNLLLVGRNRAKRSCGLKVKNFLYFFIQNPPKIVIHVCVRFKQPCTLNYFFPESTGVELLVMKRTKPTANCFKTNFSSTASFFAINFQYN